LISEISLYTPIWSWSKYIQTYQRIQNFWLAVART